MNDRCYSCDYYDESIDAETGEPYPFCNKPYNVAYPKDCPESEVPRMTREEPERANELVHIENTIEK